MNGFEVLLCANIEEFASPQGVEKLLQGKSVFQRHAFFFHSEGWGMMCREPKVTPIKRHANLPCRWEHSLALSPVRSLVWVLLRAQEGKESLKSQSAQHKGQDFRGHCCVQAIVHWVFCDRRKCCLCIYYKWGFKYKQRPERITTAAPHL